MWQTGHQSWNKKRHSTVTLNILMSDLAPEAMDRKQVTALVLLDLSKAFDSIDHMSLLKKLIRESMGTSKEGIEWFRSYLTGRKQSQSIGEEQNFQMITLKVERCVENRTRQELKIRAEFINGTRKISNRYKLQLAD